MGRCMSCVPFHFSIFSIAVIGKSASEDVRKDGVFCANTILMREDWLREGSASILGNIVRMRSLSENVCTVEHRIGRGTSP